VDVFINFVRRRKRSQQNAIRAIQLRLLHGSVYDLLRWVYARVAFDSVLHKCEDLQTVFIENTLPRSDQEGEVMERLAEKLKSIKAGITIMVGNYREDLALAVEY
jgi:hypothetical protein